MGSSVVVLLLATVNLLFGNAANPPAAKTGAPGDGTCAECHSGASDNPGSVVLVFSSFNYTPGVQQNIRVLLSPAHVPGLAGFELTARLASNPLAQAGHFDGPVSVVNGIEYASNQFSDSYIFPILGVNFNVTWTPPAINSGDIIFYVSACCG